MRYSATSAALALVLAACDDSSSSPAVGTPFSVPLVTRDGTQAGAVTVSNTASELRLDIACKGWTLERVRAAAGTSLALIPQTEQGQPLPEQFPLRSKTGSASKVHFSVPLVAPAGTELFFAVYADVRDQAKATEGDAGTEPAWGAGKPFPRKPEAMYFMYVVQRDAPPSLAGMYRTHTQDQWGGAISRADAPSYLAANFAGVYPAGVTIGVAGGVTVRFTSAAAVLNVLPDAGPASALAHNAIDPASLSNGLAGETLALTLNVDFDDRDPAFSFAVAPLGDLVIADPSSPCFGRSVRDVLALANQILAGLGNGTLTPDQALDCVRRINMNFEDGAADLGYLGLPS
jgi:hypothetical protein